MGQLPPTIPDHEKISPDFYTTRATLASDSLSCLDHHSEGYLKSSTGSMFEIEVKILAPILSQTSLSCFSAYMAGGSSLTISPPDCLLSEMSLQSSEISIQSAQTSIQSQASAQSQISISSSQSSLQSEVIVLSNQRNLGVLPSLTHTSGLLLADHRNQQQGKLDCHCVGTIKGEDGLVSSLVSAGDYIYAGSSSKNVIKVWLKENLLGQGCANYKLGYGDGSVKALAVVGDKILSAHQDHKIRVWKRPQYGEHTQADQLRLHDNYKLLATMSTAKDYLKTFLPAKNHVQVRPHHKRLWIEHVDAISALAVSKNQEFLYSASRDRSIKVWSLSDFKCLESFRAHDDAINALALSDEGFVYTGSADAKIKMWVKPDKEKKHSIVATLVGHKSAVNALALSSDGCMLYSGACDRAVIVWEIEESAQHMVIAGVLRGHRHAILCLCTVADVLCSGSADKTIRIWRREAAAHGRKVHSCVAVLQGHKGRVKCLSVSMADYEANFEFFVYSGSLDHDIKTWCVSKPRSGTESLVSEVGSSEIIPSIADRKQHCNYLRAFIQRSCEG